MAAQAAIRAVCWLKTVGEKHTPMTRAGDRKGREKIWVAHRAENFRSDKLNDISDLDPIVSLTGSDSSTLDNMLEVMHAAGMDVIQAMRILIPPAWQTVDNIDPDVRAFYEFFDCQMEPWDGPAASKKQFPVELAALHTGG